jgi:ABC-type Fe3+/spermidine/putrescine transport system ATPase subunit
MSMSDRLAIMREGEIQQVGTPEEVYDSPANPFVADFIGDANVFNGTITNENGTSTLSNDDISIGLPDTDVSGEATVVVRPEQITLSENGSGGARIRLINKEYHGSYTRYIGEGPDGQEIQIESDDRSFEIGDNVSVAIRDARIFS